MPRKLTHEEFLNKFYEKNKHANDIEVLGTYINNKTAIKCRCKIDGYEWTPIPNDLLNGHGCPKCAKKKRAQSRTKTYEQFMEDFKIKNKHAQSIEILEPYTKVHTEIKCRCKICEHEWTPTPSNLLNGHGCPKCKGIRITQNRTKTHEQFMRELETKNKHGHDIEILGDYENDKAKIKCRCKICGYKWSPTANSLLHGHGCPKCAGKVIPTTEEFKEKLYQISPDIEVLGSYIDSGTKIKCRCKICEHTWEATPNNLLKGSGCPKCTTSKGEKRIAQYLDNLGINYIYDKRYFKDLVSTVGTLLRPDFIIPSLKIWIEFDGQQHFKPVNFKGAMSEQQIQEQFKIVQENDQIKNQYAKDNNWTLIRIPYTEYDNIEQILAEYIEQEKQVI